MHAGAPMGRGSLRYAPCMAISRCAHVVWRFLGPLRQTRALGMTPLRPRAPCAIERQVKSFFVRRYPMADERHSGITMHKLSFGGGLMGLLFATGCVLIFLLGFPALWYFVAFAFALGLGVALFLRSASDRLSQRNKPMSLFAASDQRIDTPARRKRRIRWHRLPRVATA